VSKHVQALVVGGGISGLVCGYALRKAGVNALVVEALERPGGVIRSEKKDGYLLELGPQSFSATAPLLALCKELRIEKELVEAPQKAPRFLLIDGKLQAAPLSPPAFLTSPLFSAKTKWSVVRDLFGRSAAPGEEESVAAFVRRKFSAELLDKLVGPFVSGIYAGDPEMLSLQGAFPQLYEAEKSVGSVIRGMIRNAKSKPGPKERPRLCSFREGNETLVRALAANLGANLKCGARVVTIRNESAGSGPPGVRFVVDVQNTGTYIADGLVMAAPTNVAGLLLKNMNLEFPDEINKIEYAKMAVVSLGYTKSAVKHSMHGFGFLVPRSEGLRILGTVWNSSLFPARAPEGCILMTSFVGGATDPEAIQLSREELAETAHREIAPFLGIEGTPAFSNVEIYERAIPQYNLGHTGRIEALTKSSVTPINLKLIGNYLHGPAIGACVEEALKAAGELAGAK
jgi:protoporphyrinogen/coproporphyrinogen III oxidase